MHNDYRDLHFPPKKAPDSDCLRMSDIQNDEIYTQMNDIINLAALMWPEYDRDNIFNIYNLRNHTVLCNCNDTRESNFWQFFHLHFEEFGLKKLIATSYNPSGHAYMREYDGGDDGNISVGKMIQLKSDGDFRSPECIDLLQQASVVVTAPPFSLFDEYVELLVKYHKSYCILGDFSAAIHDKIFPLLRDRRMSIVNRDFDLDYGQLFFRVPGLNAKKLDKSVYYDKKRKLFLFRDCAWFTSRNWRSTPQFYIAPVKWLASYSPSRHRTCEFFDGLSLTTGIIVDNILEIPHQYRGYMFVPVSFFKYVFWGDYEICGLKKVDSGYTDNELENYRVIIKRTQF